MTYPSGPTGPVGDPPHLPPRPCSVPMKACCGLLVSDWCDCLEFAAEFKRAMREPLFFGRAA